MSIEAILRREARMRVAKNAHERTERVLSEIKEQQQAASFNLGLTLEEYNALLDNPEKYKAVINNSLENENINLSNIRKSTIRSKISGTVFNTENWDSMFKIRKMVKP